MCDIKARQVHTIFPFSLPSSSSVTHYILPSIWCQHSFGPIALSLFANTRHRLLNMKTTTLIVSAASLGAAYPGLLGAHSKHDVLHSFQEHSEVESEHDKRQLLGNLLGGVTESASALLDTVSGIVGSVAAAVDLDNKRPEKGFEFRAPGPNDSRGPCPGLNLLANYG